MQVFPVVPRGGECLLEEQKRETQLVPNFGWRFSSTHQYFFLLILLNHHEGFLRLLWLLRAGLRLLRSHRDGSPVCARVRGVMRSYSVEAKMVPKEDAEDPELEKILDVVQNHKCVEKG